MTNVDLTCGNFGDWISGIQFALDIVEKTNVFKSLNGRLSSDPLLGCEHHEFRSGPYWECYVRHIGATLYHPTGTCRMGKDSSDPEAVVDSKLRFVLGWICLKVYKTTALVIPITLQSPSYERPPCSRHVHHARDCKWKYERTGCNDWRKSCRRH